jgi:hypothetical protein
MSDPAQAESARVNAVRARLDDYKNRIESSVSKLSALSAKDTMKDLNQEVKVGLIASYVMMGLCALFMIIFIITAFFNGPYGWALVFAIFLMIFGLALTMPYKNAIKQNKIDFEECNMQDIWDNHRDLLIFFGILKNDKVNKNSFSEIEDLRLHDI